MNGHFVLDLELSHELLILRNALEWLQPSFINGEIKM